MDVEQMAGQLPVLLGAGAGAAAKAAGGAAGKAAFDRLRDRLRRDRPADAAALDRISEELAAVSASLAELVDSSDDLCRALQDLAASVEVTVVAGSQLQNYGSIERSLIARDVTTVNM